MDKFKNGDVVFAGPFKVLYNRYTHNPGPEDTGRTIVLDHTGVAMLSVEASLCIHSVPNLKELTDFLYENPEMKDAIAAVVNLFTGVHDSWETSTTPYQVPVDGLTDVDTKKLQEVCNYASKFKALSKILNGEGNA